MNRTQQWCLRGVLSVLVILCMVPAASAGSTQLTLTHKGGWAPWSRTPSFDTRRQVNFELRNPASSGPSTAGINAPAQLRYQIRCHSPGNPYIGVFAHDHAGRFPGGTVPRGGQTRQIKIVFETKRMKSQGVYAGWSAEAYDIPIDCVLTTGPFLKGQHPPKPGKSREDYSLFPGQKAWQSKLVRFRVKNEDSLQRPRDVSIDTLTLAGDQSGKDPLDGGRNFWGLADVSHNSGIPQVRVKCDLLRGGSRIKTREARVNYPPTPGGVKVSRKAAVDFGPQPKGNYETRCRLEGVPPHANRVSSNDTKSYTRNVTTELVARGPDLKVSRLEVRDKTRFGSVTPTAGSGVRVYLRLENVGTAKSAARAKIKCTATGGGSSLGQGKTWLNQSISKSGRKDVFVDLPAMRAVRNALMWCGVESAGDADPMNSAKSVNFHVTAKSNNDFKVRLTNKGGWSPWSRTPTFKSRRQVSFELSSPSPRGPASPSFAGKAELRWQAQCMVTNDPFVSVFDGGHIGRHPGGKLPAPGSKRRIKIGFETKRMKPNNPGVYADFSYEPRTLHVMCTIRTGLFIPGQHPGGGAKSKSDYSLMPGQKAWTKQVVRFEVRNNDG